MAPAPYHMPIEVVCVRVREHQHWERMPSGVVFWAGSDRDAVVIVRQNERMKEFEGGRRPTKGHSGTKEERTSEKIQELDEIIRTERSIRSVIKGRMIVLFISSTVQRDCYFVGAFFNFERRITNDQS